MRTLERINYQYTTLIFNILRANSLTCIQSLLEYTSFYICAFSKLHFPYCYVSFTVGEFHKHFMTTHSDGLVLFGSLQMHAETGTILNTYFRIDGEERYSDNLRRETRVFWVLKVTNFNQLLSSTQYV